MSDTAKALETVEKIARINANIDALFTIIELASTQLKKLQTDVMSIEAQADLKARMDEWERKAGIPSAS
jgi:hypothetical protein